MSEPMTIVLGLGLHQAYKRGIDYYAANLVEYLAEVDHENRYVLFSYFFREYAKKKASLPQPQRDNFELLVRRWPNGIVDALEWEFGLPLIDNMLLGRRPMTLFHAIGSKLPHLRRTKTIDTFYEIGELYSPPNPSVRGGEIKDRYAYNAAHRADQLITLTTWTKMDLISHYAVPEEKIEVVPAGVNLRVFRPAEDPEVLRRVRDRYGLPKKYFMVVGPFEPVRRNNAALVIKAYAELRRAGLAEDCRLVLVGFRIPYVDQLLALAAELGVEKEVVCTGYVALEDLHAVYSMALVLVHPTTYAGFGVPLEVMACGTPVISSRVPAVIEPLGDAALLIPLDDFSALVSAMRDMLAQTGLRRTLTEKGLARAGGFSYRIIAEKLLGIYERVGRQRT